MENSLQKLVDCEQKTVFLFIYMYILINILLLLVLRTLGTLDMIFGVFWSLSFQNNEHLNY